MLEDYIKRGAALDAVKDCYTWEDGVADSALTEARSRIERIQTAEVAEVVRCQDCKYWKADPDQLYQFHTCSHASGMVEARPEYFCYFGERPEVKP